METKTVTFAIGRGLETALLPKHLNNAEEMVNQLERQLKDIQVRWPTLFHSLLLFFFFFFFIRFLLFLLYPLSSSLLVYFIHFFFLFCSLFSASLYINIYIYIKHRRISSCMQAPPPRHSYYCRSCFCCCCCCFCCYR